MGRRKRTGVKMTTALWKYLVSASLGFASFVTALMANMRLYEYEMLEVPSDLQRYTNNVVVSTVLATLAVVTFISACVSAYKGE